MKALLVFPLVILLGMTFLSVAGLSSMGTTDVDVPWAGHLDGFYDANDHMVMYENYTIAGEVGTLRYISFSGTYTWTNVTDVYPTWSGAGQVNEEDRGQVELEWDWGGYKGVLALMGLSFGGTLLIAIGIAFITGGSDFLSSVAVKGGFFVALWAAFSVASYSMITTLPLYLGVMLWFFLTTMYALGAFSEIGGGG